MAAEPGVMWSNSGSVTAGFVLGIVATSLLIAAVALRLSGFAIR
jgi:hypothetical protein